MTMNSFLDKPQLKDLTQIRGLSVLGSADMVSTSVATIACHTIYVKSRNDERERFPLLLRFRSNLKLRFLDL